MRELERVSAKIRPYVSEDFPALYQEPEVRKREPIQTVVIPVASAGIGANSNDVAQDEIEAEEERANG